MNTQLATDVFARRGRRRKESPLGLFIALIKDNTRGDENAHKAAFRRLILQDGYEDFLEAVIDEWGDLKYTAALRAAKPPTVQEIRRNAERKKREREEFAKMVDAAEEKMKSRLLDLTMPNGKSLRDCTGADCIRFGGFYAKIGKKVGAKRLVGNVMTNDDLAKLLKAA